MSPPDVSSSKTLVIQTRTDGGNLWQTEVNFVPGDRTSLRKRTEIFDDQERETLETIEVVVGQNVNDVLRAVALVVKHVSFWPIHSIQFGEDRIHEEGDMTPIGMNGSEIAKIEDCIRRKLRNPD